MTAFAEFVNDRQYLLDDIDVWIDGPSPAAEMDMNRAEIYRSIAGVFIEDADGALDIDAELCFLLARSDIGMGLVLDIGIDAKGRPCSFALPACNRNEILEFGL